MNKPLVIAHRGASAREPENTIAAFMKAVSLGADGIELDVQMSADGHLVVIHDETVNRVTNGKGRVKELTLAKLKSLKVGKMLCRNFKGETIPTLEDVFNSLKGWKGLINIEIKNGSALYPGIEEKVVQMIKSFNIEDRIIISSFNHDSLVAVKKLAPDIRTGVLYSEELSNPWEYAKTLGADAIHPLYYRITDEAIKNSVRNGIAVNPYTVDKPDTIRSLALAGVSGIITNVPDVALEVLAAL